VMTSAKEGHIVTHQVALIRMPRRRAVAGTTSAPPVTNGALQSLEEKNRPASPAIVRRVADELAAEDDALGCHPG
jgi:hypothetical protein